MCTERPKPRLDFWGGKCSEPQSATEHATATSRQNCVQIQYLYPYPSRLNGARAGTLQKVNDEPASATQTVLSEG